MRLLRYLLPLLLVPELAFAAYSIPLSATSTSGTILAYPTAVNKVLPILASPYFVATSTTKSIFPYASTTAASATFFCLTGDSCISTWPTGGSGGTGVATTSLLGTAPIFLTKTAASITFSWFGLTTTTQPSASNLLTSNGSNGVYGTATSTLSASSPLTGSFVQVGSGGSLGIQAASASQNGYLSQTDWQLLHTATTTFSSPLSYSLSTNAVTCPTCYVNVGAILSTSSPWTNGQVAYVTDASHVTSVATSSHTAGTGIGILNAGTAYVIGSAPTFYQLSYVATSSAETNGNLAMFATTNSTPAGLRSISTSSVTCSGGTVTCSNVFTTGTSPTITSAGWPFTPTTAFGLTTSATSSAEWNKLAFFSSSSVATPSWIDWLNIGSTTAGNMATSTDYGNFVVAGNATTTRLVVSSISGTAGNCLQASTIGVVSGTGSACSTSANAGFTFSTIFGVANTAATTSAMQITGDLFASSTIQFGNAGVSSQLLWNSANGNLGIASTTPEVNCILCIGNSAGAVYGSIINTENKVSTSTAITIDWSKGNQQLAQIGTAAVKIGFNNASTSGQTLRLVVCNPGSTAGALTWIAPIQWSGGGATPAQTTTASVCDVYSFIITQATSTTEAGRAIWGTQVANFP